MSICYKCGEESTEGRLATIDTNEEYDEVYQEWFCSECLKGGNMPKDDLLDMVLQVSNTYNAGLKMGIELGKTRTIVKIKDILDKYVDVGEKDEIIEELRKV